ncbi:acyl-CoA dehydrogenase family protein [Ruegeria sp.]|uniref:acyl-CoA dehydrogenase family protein n=1 Tax=Ruegeria sp. TaxID=1879320 RepID=UPI003C7EB1A9
MSRFDSPSEAQFRQEARAWLVENARAFSQEFPGEAKDEQDALIRAKAWQKRKFDAGYAGLFIPREYGGGGRTFVEELIFREEQRPFKMPRGPFVIGLGLAAPVLLAYADEETKRELLPRALSGEEIWCQLFSEPGAGSDLAGIRTRATRDGDDWIVSGQKVWNTFAHLADRAILVTRSDPTVPKHKGLTFFQIPMTLGGISTRPLRMVNGEAEFNETFLDDVRIPDACRLGEPGDGWQVSMSTLRFERFEVSSFPGVNHQDLLDFALAREIDGQPMIADSLVQDNLARWYAQEKAIENTQLITLAELSQGREPGPEVTFGKLVDASKMQSLGEFAMDLMGFEGACVDSLSVDAPQNFQGCWLWSPGGRIAGGTDEIVRNVIAERVLGLPKEDRPDANIPFNQL